MRLKELKEVSNFKLDSIEHFKAVVLEAIESTYHWKEHCPWLHEEYRDCSGEDNQYRAQIIVLNESYNIDTKRFIVGYNNISSVTIYDIFYTDISGGGFVIDDVTLGYDSIKSFERLLI